MNNIWVVLKVLLFPRTITVHDLVQLSTILDNKLSVENLDYVRMLNDPTQKLATLSILSLKPIVIMKRNSVHVKRANLEHWYKIEIETLKTLINNNYVEEAKMLATAFIREFIFLMSLYIFIENVFGAKKRFFKGEFEREALDFLLSLTKNDELKNILEELGLSADFDFAVQAYIISMESALKASQKVTDASEYLLSKISEYKKSIESLDDLLNRIHNLNELTKRRVLEHLLFIINILLRQKVFLQEKTTFFWNIIKNIKPLVSNNIPSYKDLLWVLLNEILELITDIETNGNPENIEKTLEHLGKYLINERYNYGAFSERILLRAPPESRLLIVPPIISPINQRDLYITVSMDFIINETLQIIVGPHMEIQHLLSIIFDYDENFIWSTIRKISENPLASYAFLHITGSIGSWIIDNLLVALFSPQENKELTEKILRVALNYFKEYYELTRRLLEKTKSMSAKKFIAYPLFREFYFSTLKLTSEVIEKIKKYEPSQELIKLLEEISILLDSVYEIAPRKKPHMPDELIA